MTWVPVAALLLLQYPCTGAESCAGVEDTSLLQSFQAKLQQDSGEKAAATLAQIEKSRRERRKKVRDDHAKVRVEDLTDYRGDAHIFLQEALKKPELSSRCNLPRMSLAEVEQHWEEELDKKLRKVKKHADKERAVQELRAEFNSKLRNNMPVLVQNVVSQLKWPAAKKWSQAQMTERLRNKEWEIHTFYYPDWIMNVEEPEKNHSLAHETLDEYLGSDQSAKNFFLFASEDGSRSESWKTEIVDTIRDDFKPHPNFAYLPDEKEAIFAVDAIGSSHGFHAHDPVWQVQVEGYKMWHLLPPTAEVTEQNPVGFPEWGSSPLDAEGKPFEHPNACAMLKQFTPPPQTMTCMVAPGEMLLLPDSWLHATCGLSNYTAAVGGWLGMHWDDDEKDDDEK
eukprot:gb/GFBE01071919.1/.p1 GENE.gb/GFBE01071919.1/~~gb/GFBE01071919.1/.p1  ORF type:complete len:395 (+),score=129.37 gb/GFBE01071919.1/:1-1185(+)